MVADFNNDGKPDIATSNYLGADVSILLGNGDGTFQAQVTYPVGNQPRTLTFGDFNGDGIIDLAVANQEDSTLSILFGNGDGTFQAADSLSDRCVAAGSSGVGFQRRRHSRSCHWQQSGGNTVGILLGNSDGTFQPMTTYAVGNEPVGPVVADFNGDGIADMAVREFPRRHGEHVAGQRRRHFRDGNDLYYGNESLCGGGRGLQRRWLSLIW